jgi:hypothetical protein
MVVYWKMKDSAVASSMVRREDLKTTVGNYWQLLLSNDASIAFVSRFDSISRNLSYFNSN